MHAEAGDVDNILKYYHLMEEAQEYQLVTEVLFYKSLLGF